MFWKSDTLCQLWKSDTLCQLEQKQAALQPLQGAEEVLSGCVLLIWELHGLGPMETGNAIKA